MSRKDSLHVGGSESGELRDGSHVVSHELSHGSYANRGRLEQLARPPLPGSGSETSCELESYSNIDTVSGSSAALDEAAYQAMHVFNDGILFQHNLASEEAKFQVVGDLHGTEAHLDQEKDLLPCLGDVVLDGIEDERGPVEFSKRLTLVGLEPHVFDELGSLAEVDELKKKMMSVEMTVLGKRTTCRNKIKVK